MKPLTLTRAEVLAQLAGETSIVRKMKPQPKQGNDGSLMFPWATFWPNGTVHTWDRSGGGGQNWNANEYPGEDKFAEALKRTDYVNPSPLQTGDVWYGKETFAIETWSYEFYDEQPPVSTPERPVLHEEDDQEERWLIPHYLATDPDPGLVSWDSDEMDDRTRWSPNMHMPRWAARIWRQVESVTVEQRDGVWCWVYRNVVINKPEGE